jgi:hypothetical protein
MYSVAEELCAIGRDRISPARFQHSPLMMSVSQSPEMYPSPVNIDEAKSCLRKARKGREPIAELCEMAQKILFDKHVPQMVRGESAGMLGQLRVRNCHVAVLCSPVSTSVVHRPTTLAFPTMFRNTHFGRVSSSRDSPRWSFPKIISSSAG